MYYIRSTDKTKIAVYDLNSKACKTVFMLHGWPLNHKMFEYQIHQLIELNYRVITIDLRGFGNSDETAYGYHYNQLATDVYMVISSLKLQNITLVGFSMGGAIAVRYMCKFKGHGVSKLALWDAAAPSYTRTENNPYGVTIENANHLIALGYKDRPALNAYFGSIFFAKEHSKPLTNWFQRMSDSASPVSQMNTLKSLRDEDVFKDLRAIKVPTGIFHGKLDKVCAYEMSDIQLEQIKHAKRYTFAHSGHGAFYDELEAFNRCFCDFLQGETIGNQKQKSKPI